MAMIGPWVALLAGGLCEAGFTTALRHIDGGRNIGALIAFLLSVTGRQIPMGTAYAVWAGIGAAATAIIGVAFYAEPMSIVRGLLIAGLIGCIVGLKALG
jgi:quaternary ammonium compound-resistance protein SugE